MLESQIGLAIVREAAPYARAQLRRIIRDAMVQAGLGRRDRDVPLSDVIEPGMSVLLKPNWVLHFNQSGQTMDCMVTHPQFILAALDEVLAARPGRVIIADAPIQAADFEALTPAGWRSEVAAACGSVPFSIVDLRNRTSRSVDGVLTAVADVRPPGRFVLFDLGRDSLLEPVSEPGGRFRVANYDPSRLAATHQPGKHQFLLAREPFEADVILNLPKLKGHAKAGLTAALKNLVGLNGDKDFLPHHRSGGSAWGGDCYRGFKPSKRAAEILLDAANRRIGRRSYKVFHRAAALVNGIHRGPLDGRWAGNDTTWRMVLDLNRILLYGRSDGTLADGPVRPIYSLTDGVVAGEHNGPLAPKPVPLGAVTFGASSAFVDLAHAALMRFDADRVPLLRHAFGPMRYPLTARPRGDGRIACQGQLLTMSETAMSYGVPFVPPDGWEEIALDRPTAAHSSSYMSEPEVDA